VVVSACPGDLLGDLVGLVGLSVGEQEDRGEHHRLVRRQRARAGPQQRGGPGSEQPGQPRSCASR
jgi:hypothetical protein